ncbi:MAG: 50S ribosomal protein L11 methyltransferase [Hyphomicrobiaceae bacterium]
MRIEYHRTLIADVARNRAFRDALAKVIVNGKTKVADIGAGTGLIGLIAARLGAREVYLYETAEVAGVAAEVLKRNRARNCHLLGCHSTEAVDPPRVDVVVSETLGNYAFEEDIAATMNDARKRHLKPGGKIIPSRIQQFVAPVVTPRFDEDLRAWEATGGDLGLAIDLTVARDMSFNNVYVRRIEGVDLLDGGAAATRWDDADLTRECSGTRKGEARWTLREASTIYGFAVWWEAVLADGITLSTSPDATPTHWEQLYFPIAAPITAKPGEAVSVALKSRSSPEAGTHLAWKASHVDAQGRALARHAHDLDKGYLP